MPTRRTHDEDDAILLKLRAAVASNSIATASRDELAGYMTWLCEDGCVSKIGGDAQYGEFCELVRFHMLRSAIDAFEERSKFLTRVVVVLAAASIVATLLPYIIAANPPFGAKPVPTEPTSKTTAKIQQSQPLPEQPLPLGKPQVSGQALAKHASSSPSTRESK